MAGSWLAASVNDNVLSDGDDVDGWEPVPSCIRARSRSTYNLSYICRLAPNDIPPVLLAFGYFIRLNHSLLVPTDPCVHVICKKNMNCQVHDFDA